MSAWTDDTPLLGTSDNVLCKHITQVNDFIRIRNAEIQQKQYADVQTTGSSLGPRNKPAPCGVYPQRPKPSDMERLIPNGFMLDVCPEDSYANQLTFDSTKTCTRSHQTFLNTTKRGAGTKPGSNRGMTR
jgi:hypothetical protein